MARQTKRYHISGLRKKYDAVFLGIGTHKVIKMNVPGEDLKGVHHGAEFLRKVNIHHLGVKDIKLPKLGKRIAVVGGGNVAIDSAMTALRLSGGEVFVIYRRTRAEMPAFEWEVAEAEEEGIQFLFLTNPLEIKGEGGKVTALELQRMRLGEPDSSGRRRPVPIEGDTFTLPIDTMIISIGQVLDDVDDEVMKNDRGWIKTDEITRQTNLLNVFAGGDDAIGPSSIVEVVGEGHIASESIKRYLLGEDLAAGREKPVAESKPAFYEPASWDKTQRHKNPARDPGTRIDFDEIYMGFTEEQPLPRQIAALLWV